MAAEPDPERRRSLESISDDMATRLLDLSIAEETPIEALLTRLTLKDGEAWFLRALETPPISARIRQHAELLESQRTFDELDRLKNDCKRQLDTGANLENKSVAALGYFLAQAAALVHHGRPLSKRSELLVATLKDLAAVSPAPFDAFLESALAVLRTLD